MKKVIVFGYKYRRRGFDCGRTLLRDCRRYWARVGSYTFGIELNGWGPTP